jgi:hypothetical protein
VQKPVSRTARGAGVDGTNITRNVVTRNSPLPLHGASGEASGYDSGVLLNVCGLVVVR